MNLVDMIKDQFTEELTGQFRSVTGGGETQTRSALGAAVPAVLAALSGVASSGGSGAEQLAAAVDRCTPDSLHSLTGLMRDDPDEVAQQGGGLLNALLGGGTIGSLATAISRMTGIDSATAKKLLGMAAPFVMGAIARQFQGKPATPQGLAGLFTEQKANIAAAIPAGLPLADIPGLSEMRSMGARVATDAQRAAAATRETGSPLLKTLLPVAALALLAFAAWQFLRKPAEQPDTQPIVSNATDPTTHTVQRPVVDPTAALPDIEQMSGDLKSVFTGATDALNGITDVPTAEAALPTLEALNTQLNGIGELNTQLPAAARTTITTLISDQIGPLTQLIEKVLAIPGVRDKLDPVLSGMLAKFRELEA
jgi:hypothetical protein